MTNTIIFWYGFACGGLIMGGLGFLVGGIVEYFYRKYN